MNEKQILNINVKIGVKNIIVVTLKLQNML